jgi:hypothetical protein
MNGRTVCVSCTLFLASTSFAELPERWEDPAAVEQVIWSHLQENAKEHFTSIQEVKCGATRCQIRFTGTRIHDDNAVHDRLISDLMTKLLKMKIPVRSAASGKAEISPGVEGTIVTLSSERHNWPTPRP